MPIEHSVETVVETVDKETGEITIERVTTSKTFTKRVNSENFYFIFLESLAPSLKLSYGELRLMNALNFKAVYNTGTFVLSMKQREELCETLGIKKQSLSNSLNSLKRKKLLAYDRGEWTINPTYFWKGSLKDRSAKLKDMSLKMTFEISRDFETCEDND